MKTGHSQVVAFLIFIQCFLSEGYTEDDDGFRPLFRENDLSGWVPVNVAPSTFRMENGILRCSGKPIGEIRTERMYQNFILEIEWRHLVPKGNAGIFIWADDLTARGVPFHRGIEVQVLENEYGNTERYSTHGDIFPIHGATMTPVNGRGGQRAFPTESRSKPSPEWNHYRIEAIDGRISLSVNGEVVTRGVDCNPRKGYVCIESEGGVVEYRNARIKDLPGSEVPIDETAIANRGYKTLYTGIDFSGWKTEEGWTVKDWQIDFEGDDPLAELTTTSSRGDFGFVFDFKLSENSGSPSIFLRGRNGPRVLIDRSTFSSELEDFGNWNRMEGTVIGNGVMGTINGTPFRIDLEEDYEPAAGPIIIVPDGPVRFANIFVRELE